MTWTITDRITRINFYAVLVVAAVAMWPLMSGSNSLIFMAAVLMLVYQAWRLAMAREVRGSLDEAGLAKKIGTHTRHVAWEHITSARFARLLGTNQLIVTTTDEIGWQPSDRWYGRLGRHELAVQVPSGALPQVREILQANGVPLA
ncbi:MAG: hypothetical protein CVT62_02720 [Actinobacteria bacterium HGW-Actinobacteria-2]|nr:MAG: hypothetical protein CVT62_02720 [Actinobacteria bacterium HGW-Actinobacteria-2]